MSNLKIGKVVDIDLTDLSYDDIDDKIISGEYNDSDKIKDLCIKGGWTCVKDLNSNNPSASARIISLKKNNIEITLIEKFYINKKFKQNFKLTRDDNFKQKF